VSGPVSDRRGAQAGGQSQIALDRASARQTVAEKKRVDLDVEQAFGPYDEKKKVTIRREELPPHLKAGAVSKTRDGIPFIVLDLSDTSAVVDFNHPLAGKHVVFDIKIVTVEPRS
jgi:peptidylprolyl isomerase